MYLDSSNVRVESDIDDRPHHGLHPAVRVAGRVLINNIAVESIKTRFALDIDLAGYPANETGYTARYRIPKQAGYPVQP